MRFRNICVPLWTSVKRSGILQLWHSREPATACCSFDNQVTWLSSLFFSSCVCIVKYLGIYLVFIVLFRIIRALGSVDGYRPSILETFQLLIIGVSLLTHSFPSLWHSDKVDADLPLLPACLLPLFRQWLLRVPLMSSRCFSLTFLDTVKGTYAKILMLEDEDYTFGAGHYSLLLFLIICMIYHPHLLPWQSLVLLQYQLEGQNPIA